MTVTTSDLSVTVEILCLAHSKPMFNLVLDYLFYNGGINEESIPEMIDECNWSKFTYLNGKRSSISELFVDKVEYSFGIIEKLSTIS